MHKPVTRACCAAVLCAAFAAAKSTSPDAVNGKTYDLIVVGGTPAGIACAVRAAREGLSVLLVQHNRHIGGMLANALMQWDALYAGHLFNRLVSAETNITTLLSHYPAAVTRTATCLNTILLREYGTTNDITACGGCFGDATYEGDLAALANVPYRVGREGRDEYGEPRIAAAQYFGTQGFFADYDARLDEPLSADVHALWLNAFDKLRRGTLDPARLATAIHAAEAKEQPAADKQRGEVLMQLWRQLNPL